MRLGVLTSFGPQARKGCGGAEFPGLGALFTGPFNRLPERGLSRVPIGRFRGSPHATSEPQQFGIAPLLVASVHLVESSINQAHAVGRALNAP